MFRSSGYQADQIESCLEKLLTKWTVTSNNGGDLIVLRSIEEYPWRHGEAHAQRLKWLMRWKSSKHRFVPQDNVQNDKALSYGFYPEMYVTKENIEAYVINICAFMMHKKLFGGDSYSFSYFVHQLVNFCRQC